MNRIPRRQSVWRQERVKRSPPSLAAVLEFIRDK
jgi:hypothetical protein